ncbi:MAG: nucleotidyltransferase family protein [Candidatus Sedimenticola sp. 6PFRAG1]
MNNSELFTILCDCLAFTDDNDRLHSILSAPDFPWEAFIESASKRLVTPALHNALGSKGLLSEIPSDVTDYLEAAQYLNRERNQELLGDLQRIAEELNSQGITPVALKGGASLAENLYPDPGMRVLSDLDILIPRERLESCIEILQNLDFQIQPGFRDELSDYCHHYYPLAKTDGVTVIELHLEMIYEGCQEMLPLTLLKGNTRTITWQNSQIAVLSPTLRLLHNILHTHIADKNFYFSLVNLRQLYEFGMIVQNAGADLDWSLIFNRFRNGTSLQVLEHYMLLGNALLNIPIPLEVQNQAVCDKALKNLLWRIEHPGYLAIHKTSVVFRENLVNALREPGKFRRLFNPEWISFRLKKLGEIWSR